MRRLAAVLLLISPFATAQEFAWPDEMPDNWLLAFVDVETTGLIPGHHEMIDIGIVMTDLDGAELGDLFLRIQPEHPERTDEGARAVNAFAADRWRELNALPPADAIDAMLEFHNEIANGRYVLMVAFNSQFDTAFLDHLFRTQDRSWRELYHYFVLDLPSMAWSLGFRGLTGTALSNSLDIEDEPHVAELHTGITGARLNARIYRSLLAGRNRENSND
ncbi:MAG: 3'-5' exonuclease [Woeseiaceae bacterium]